MSTKPVAGGPRPVARAEISTQGADPGAAPLARQVADGVDVEVFPALAELNRLGAEPGIGVHEFDRDGSPGLTARVSALFLALGACVGKQV